METLRDVMVVRGVPAIVAMNTRTFMASGEFIGLSRCIRFEADKVSELRRKAGMVLEEFLAQCRSLDRHPLAYYGGTTLRYVIEDAYDLFEQIASQRGQTLESLIHEQQPFSFSRGLPAYEKLMRRQREMDRQFYAQHFENNF